MHEVLPEAYEHLLLDCIEGDSTLFARRDEVEAAWKIADDLPASRADGPIQSYPAGTWGPEEAAGILKTLRPPDIIQ